MINHVWFSEHGWPSLQLDALVESVPTSGVIRMYRELYSTVSAAVQGNITTPTDAVFISRVTSTAAAGGASSSASAIPLPPTPSLVDGEEDEETQLMRAIALSAMAFQSTPDPVAAHSPVFEAVDEEDEEALLAQALALSVQQHTTAEVASPTPAPPPLPPTTTPLAPSPPVIPPPPANVPKSSFSIVNALETVSLEQAKLQLLTFLIAGTCGGFEARRKNAILRAGELSSATLPSGTSDVSSEDSKGDVDEEDTKDDDASAALTAPDPTDPDEIPYAATGLKTTALLFTLGGISAITDVRQQLLFVLMSGACERIAQLSSSLPDSAKFTEVSSACVDAQLFRYLMAISQLQPAALFPQSVLTEPTFLRALTDLVGRVIASPRVTAVSSRLLKKILSSSSIVPMGSLVSDVLSSIASRHPLAGQYPVSRLSDPIHAPVGHGSSAGAAIVSHSLSRLLCDLSHSPAWSDAISNELESRVIDGADASASNDRLVSAVTALSLLDGSVGWQMIPGSPIIIHDTPSLAEGRGLSDFGSVSELTNSALATGVLVEYLPRTQLARVVYSQAGSSVGYDLSNIVEVDAANIEPVPVAATVKLSHRLLSAMESILSRPPQLPSGAGGASSRDVQVSLYPCVH